MRRYRCDRAGSHPVQAYGSHGVHARGIQHAPARLVVTSVWLEAGGEIGSHEAPVDQLFLVLEGTGWAEGEGGARSRVSAGEALFWQAGEVHAIVSEEGLAALVLEGEGLDPDAHLPLAEEG